MFSKIVILCVFFTLGTAVPSNLTKSVFVRSADAYSPSSNAVSFAQAWAYCVRDNKNFASLISQSENDYVAQSLYGYSTSSFWIGGIYLQHGALQKWYWVSEKQEVSYFNWKSLAPSIPVNSATDYCLLYNYNASSKTATWTAENCAADHYFICAKV